VGPANVPSLPSPGSSLFAESPGAPGASIPRSRELAPSCRSYAPPPLPRLPPPPRLRRRPRRLRRRPPPPSSLTELAAAHRRLLLAPAAGPAHRLSGPARPAALPRRRALRRSIRRHRLAAAAPGLLFYSRRPWSHPTPGNPNPKGRRLPPPPRPPTTSPAAAPPHQPPPRPWQSPSLTPAPPPSRDPEVEEEQCRAGPPGRDSVSPFCDRTRCSSAREE